MHRELVRFASICQALLTCCVIHAQSFTGDVHLSDSLLQRIWESSREGWNGFDTEQYDALLRGPHGAFWPDPTPGIRAQYYAQPDEWYTKSMLGMVFRPRYATPGREAFSGGSLHWPVMLETYLRHTGDREYVEHLVRDAMPGWLAQVSALRFGDSALIMSDEAWPSALSEGIETESAFIAPNAITNAFYLRALGACQRLNAGYGIVDDALDRRLALAREEYGQAFWNAEAGLVADLPEGNTFSVATTAVAVVAGLVPDEGLPAAVQLIRSEGFNCAPLFVPYVIEACFVAGETQLGVDLLTFLENVETNPAAVYLIPEYVYGVTPAEPGWSVVQVSPRFPPRITEAALQVPVPGGRVSLRYAAETGSAVTVGRDRRVLIDAPEGQNVVVKTYRSHEEAGMLTDEQRALLSEAGWHERVGDDAAVWVNIDEQVLRIVQGDAVVYQARCASAKEGVGSIKNSLQTPLGWHRVHRKIGGDAPWGQVFRARQPTREVWQPGEDVTEDLVLTRVILLDGLEDGLNRGGNVDSLARHIYIHGTNDEARVGTPSSHGCIRMTNDDVIEAFEKIPNGMLVLLTATAEG